MFELMPQEYKLALEYVAAVKQIAAALDKIANKNTDQNHTRESETV